MAVLSCLDLFFVEVWWVALSNAANMRKKLPSDAADLVMEAVPLLTKVIITFHPQPHHHARPSQMSPSTISITFNLIPLSPCTYPCWYPFFHDHHMSTSLSHIPIILNPFNRSTSLRILLWAHLVSHLLLHPTHHSSILLISPSPRSMTSTPSPSPVLCCLPTPTSATVAVATAPQVPLPRVTPLGDRVSSREVWAATRFSTVAAIFHTHLLWSRRKCSKPLFFSPPFLSPHLFYTHFLSLSFALNSIPHDLCLHVHFSNLSSVFTTPLIHFPSAFQMHSLHMSISMQSCKLVRLVPCTQHSPSCSIFLYPQAHCPPILRFHPSPSYISSFMHSVHAFSLYSTSLIPISPPKASHFSRHLFSLYTTPLHTPPFLTYLHHLPHLSHAPPRCPRPTGFLWDSFFSP